MPHGLTIDHEGNTWLTDVALHQVCVSFYLLVFVGESPQSCILVCLVLIFFCFLHLLVNNWIKK